MDLARAIDQLARNKKSELLRPPKSNQGYLIQCGEENKQANEEVEETIFIIMGGEEDKEKQSRKRTHVDGTFSFSKKDMEGVKIPHQTPWKNKTLVHLD